MKDNIQSVCLEMFGLVESFEIESNKFQCFGTIYIGRGFSFVGCWYLAQYFDNVGIHKQILQTTVHEWAPNCHNMSTNNAISAYTKGVDKILTWRGGQG